ncbi:MULTISPECIES: hypothetical protein, partial [Klebsiella pneumoniae complex]|uniref:hypothetical protein n=1 Tax=Klebsiella pneumoniae complex TaxID=3390273 RepID=UPI002730FFEC
DYSPHQFSPNYFIEISKYWEIKKRALLAYGSEIKDQKTSRDLNSLKTFYKFRGNSYQSNLSYVINKKLVDIFDFIRMLDASNYPKAFYKLGNKKIELTDVSLNNQFVKGKFIIKKK